jgi:hypothetical protein
MLDLDQIFKTGNIPISRQVASSSLASLSMRMDSRSLKLYAGHAGTPTAAGLPLRAKVVHNSPFCIGTTPEAIRLAINSQKIFINFV